jgi:hypothetical protein
VPHIIPFFHATGMLLVLAIMEVAGCYALAAALIYRRQQWFGVSIFVLLTVAFGVIFRFGLPLPIANVLLGPIAVIAFVRLKRVQWSAAKLKSHQTLGVRSLP